MEIWQWLLTACGGVAVVGGAVGYVGKAFKPACELVKRVSATETKLDNDNRRLKVLEDGARAQNLALLALLGGNEDDIRRAKAALQKYLVER